jgi:hypothetical protein
VSDLLIPADVMRDARTYARQFGRALVCYYFDSGVFRIKSMADEDGAICASIDQAGERFFDSEEAK